MGAVGLAPGQIRMHPEHGMIYIVDGDYERNGRVSNHWRFRKVLHGGQLSPELLGGYGDNRWPIRRDVQAKVHIVRCEEETE